MIVPSNVEPSSHCAMLGLGIFLAASVKEFAGIRKEKAGVVADGSFLYTRSYGGGYEEGKDKTMSAYKTAVVNILFEKTSL